MINKEKVIKELGELCEYLFRDYKVCYHVDEEDAYNRFLIADNALDLLKEQEEQIKNRDESLEKAREEIKWLRGMLKERNDNFDLYDTPIFGFHD